MWNLQPDLDSFVITRMECGEFIPGLVHLATFIWDQKVKVFSPDKVTFEGLVCGTYLTQGSLNSVTKVL